MPNRDSVLHDLAGFLADHNTGGWLVGGALRDLLLGMPGYDLDIAVDGPALELARRFADQHGGAFVALDDTTETARVVWKQIDRPDVVIDLVRLRAATIEQDLRLRDVTINALALPLDRIRLPLGAAMPAATDLIDPTNGRNDLRDRVIRPCGPRSLTDDPVRVLRAVRFAAHFDATLAPETDAAIRTAAPLLSRVAIERTRDELIKLLAAEHAAPWLVYLDDVGLLTGLIPELAPARGCVQPPEHWLDVLHHLFDTVAAWEWVWARLQGRAVPNDARPFALPGALRSFPDLDVALPYIERITARMSEPIVGGGRRFALFKLAVLLHDIGKPATRTVTPEGRITFYGHDALGAQIAGGIGRRLKLGRENIEYLRLIVDAHMRPGQLRSLGSDLTPRAVYRLLRDTGRSAPDVLIHSLCDHMAVRGPMLEPAWWEQHLRWTAAMLDLLWSEQRVAAPIRLIDGRDVLALGVEPGPIVGRVLAAIEEAHFSGEIQTREEALQLAGELIRES